MNISDATCRQIPS